MIGKLVFSWDYFNQCVAIDESLFNNQHLLSDLIKKNQTWFDSIEDDSRFYSKFTGGYTTEIFPREFEEIFKGKYKIFLRGYEKIVQKYADVFFGGYFEIADKDDDKVLEALWKMHSSRKKVLSMSFEDKKIYDLALENKQMQNAIGNCPTFY